MMSMEKVKAYFAQLGMEQRVLEFEVSSATVELAAQAAGVEPKRIAKTLSFLVGGYLYSDCRCGRRARGQ